jgi:hypothetical protein
MREKSFLQKAINLEKLTIWTNLEKETPKYLIKFK